MDARSDRAQLILVGAVAIAFIVLGLAVVFNTVLYTENVASTGAASAPRDAQIVKNEVDVGLKGLVERVNHQTKPKTNSQANTNLTDNVSAYSDGMTKVVGEVSPALVSFRVSSVADVKHGARIRDDDGSDFKAPGGAKNWTLMDPVGDGAMVGDFDMTVDRSGLEAGTQDAFHIVWSPPGSSDNHVVWIYEKSSSKVAIRTVNDSGSPARDFSGGNECVLPGSDSESTVSFNFSDGNVQGYDACDSYLGPWPHIDNDTARNITFYRADNVTGTYSLAINDQSELNPTLALPVSVLPSQPYWTSDVWKFKIDFRYRSGQLTFTDDEYFVEVYNRSR
jgi:hypothetical protein